MQAHTPGRNPVAAILETIAELRSPAPTTLTDEALAQLFKARVSELPVLRLDDGTQLTVGLSDKSSVAVAAGEGVHLIITSPTGADGKALEKLTPEQLTDALAKMLRYVNDSLGEQRRLVTFGINCGSFLNRPQWHAHMAIYVRDDARVASQWQAPGSEDAREIDLSDAHMAFSADRAGSDTRFAAATLTAQPGEGTEAFSARAFETFASSWNVAQEVAPDAAGGSVRMRIPADSPSSATLAFVTRPEQQKPPRLVDKPKA